MKLKHSKPAETAVELHPLIAERWSPRAFSEKTLTDEQLLQVFEAARWAASSSNEQPWAFIVARRGEAHYDQLFDCLVEGNQRWAHTAPVLVATLARKKLQKREGDNRHAWHDLGLAMGNLSAQATAMGLYLHQMGGFKPQQVQESFGVNPNEFDAVTMFVLGYHSKDDLARIDERYAKSELAVRERKPLAEQVFGAGYGQKAEWLP